jgi:hypothetical protein
MKQANVHSFNNLLPTGTRGDHLSLRFQCAGTFMSVVSIKQINEQDSNYYGMT